MNLKERLKQEILLATKTREKRKLMTLRMVKTQIEYLEIEKKRALTEEECQSVIVSEAKKHKEALEEFRKAGRDDLVSREEYELEVIGQYLPEQLPEEELVEVVIATIAEVGAGGPNDLGKVMGALMPKVRGKADGKLINQLVREHLASQQAGEREQD